MRTNDYPIPVQVIEHIQDYVKNIYPTITPKNSIKLIDRLIQLWINILIAQSAKRFSLNGESKDTFLNNFYVNISRTTFKKFRITCDERVFTYSELLQILSELRLIDINDKYSESRFSKSYRINPELDFSSTQKIQIDFRKIVRLFTSLKDLIEANPSNIKHIKDLYLTKIDLEGYFNSVDSKVGQVYKFSKGKGVVLTPKVAYGLKIRGLKINLGIHSFSESSTGRHYTSIANLPSLALPFLTLNGNRVKEIDAANCQPLLLNAIIDNPKFKADCEDGSFYDKMALNMGMSRNEFKLISFAKVFFNNSLIKGKLAKCLEAVYPLLVDQINEFKFQSRSAAEQAGEERTLWFKLQSLEASIFISASKLENTPVLTRHDSILVSDLAFNRTTNRLTQKFLDLNLKVTLK